MTNASAIYFGIDCRLRAKELWLDSEEMQENFRLSEASGPVTELLQPPIQSDVEVVSPLK